MLRPLRDRLRGLRASKEWVSDFARTSRLGESGGDVQVQAVRDRDIPRQVVAGKVFACASQLDIGEAVVSIVSDLMSFTLEESGEGCGRVGIWVMR